MSEFGARLFAAAALRAVELYEQGTAADRKPEERIRQCLLLALHENPDVAATQPEISETRELPPELPEWPNIPPSRLGGYDLAVRLRGDKQWRYLAELKWDYLWMVLWDLFKLAHASRLPGVETTFMIAIQLETEWARPVECAELFDDHVVSTRTLLERYEGRWRNMDGVEEPAVNAAARRRVHQSRRRPDRDSLRAIEVARCFSRAD